MKIGILYNRNTTNLGDDIQAYAAANLAGGIDVLAEREDLVSPDGFYTADTEEPGKIDGPVAVVMAAWFMGKKWRWPPADNVKPLFTGFHYTDFTGYQMKYFRSQYEYVSGPGAQYLNAWGPVGCRDWFTVEELKKRGVDAYFSGCITLTLPRQPRTEEAGTYVVLADASPEVENKVRQTLEGTGVRVVTTTHLVSARGGRSFAERRADTEALLTLYQNARCVITRRLHVSLPCLAMQVPVMLVSRSIDLTRFRPYQDWLRCMTDKEFVESDPREFLLSPAPNSDAYLPYREALIAQITEFYRTMRETDDCPPHSPIPYGETELLRWQRDVMSENLLRWYDESKGLIRSLKNETEARAAAAAKTAELVKSRKSLLHKNKVLAARSEAAAAGLTEAERRAEAAEQAADEARKAGAALKTQADELAEKEALLSSTVVSLTAQNRELADAANAARAELKRAAAESDRALAALRLENETLAAEQKKLRKQNASYKRTLSSRIVKAAVKFNAFLRRIFRKK